jgi:hypothetical protein
MERQHGEEEHQGTDPVGEPYSAAPSSAFSAVEQPESVGDASSYGQTQARAEELFERATGQSFEETEEQVESARDAITRFVTDNWPAFLAAAASLVALLAVAMYRARTRQRRRVRLPENITELADVARERGRRVIRRAGDGRMATRLVRAVPKPELPQLDLKQPTTLFGIRRAEPRGLARLGAGLERAREGVAKRLPVG